MIATVENVQLGTILCDTQTGDVWTIDRLPSKKLRSFGTHTARGTKVFIYRNELARFLIVK